MSQEDLRLNGKVSVANMVWYVLIVALVNLGLGYGMCLLIMRSKSALATGAEHGEDLDG